jgi:2',3'-cyclic-nucleotide 2'-phosphodiesterase (5'-nucleotidase family)
VKIVYSIKREEMGRLESVMINDEELDMKKEYQIVTTKYLKNGGDGIVSLKNGKLVDNEKNGFTCRFCLINYLKYLKFVDYDLIENRLINSNSL